MAGRSETTQTLRAKLFDAIEKLADGRISHQDASAIAKLSGEIIKTADLEMRFAKEVAALDQSDTGVSPGPILLTDRSAQDA